MSESPIHRDPQPPIKKLPSRKHTEAELTHAWEQHANKVLSDEEVIFMVTTPGVISIDAAIDWFGGKGLRTEERPVNRFGQIIVSNFDNIPDSERTQFISRAARFALLDFRQVFNLSTRTENRWRWVANPVFTIGSGAVKSSHLENIKQLFSKALRITGNDIRVARSLITHDLSGNTREGGVINRALLKLFSSKPIGAGDSDSSDQNPNISALAFWIDADLGDFATQSSSFRHLIDSVFPKADPLIKIQILTYLREVIISGKIRGTQIGYLRLILAQHEQKSIAENSALKNELKLTQHALALKRPM